MDRHAVLKERCLEARMTVLVDIMHSGLRALRRLGRVEGAIGGESNVWRVVDKSWTLLERVDEILSHQPPSSEVELVTAEQLRAEYV